MTPNLPSSFSCIYIYMTQTLRSEIAILGISLENQRCVQKYLFIDFYECIINIKYLKQPKGQQLGIGQICTNKILHSH
jgi:hypothetical protein